MFITLTPGLPQKDSSEFSACQNMEPSTSTSERDQGKKREHEEDQEVSLAFKNAI
jgi:hypothetical protein